MTTPSVLVRRSRTFCSRRPRKDHTLHQGRSLHARGDRVAWATCCDDLGRRREMPEAYSMIRAERAGVQGHRPPAALDARHLEVDPAATPRSTTFGMPLDARGARGCGEDLLEAPIVDLWVILSAVASVVAGMEAMMHLGAMVGGAGGCRAVLRACRTMRAFLRARVRVAVWRARARVHSVSASDWDAASPMARLDPDRRSCRAPRWRPCSRDGPFNTPIDS